VTTREVSVPAKASALVASSAIPETLSEAAGYPVQLVNVPLDGVPRAGVIRVGEVALTGAPVPVDVVSVNRPLESEIGIAPAAFPVV